MVDQDSRDVSMQHQGKAGTVDENGLNADANAEDEDSDGCNVFSDDIYRELKIIALKDLYKRSGEELE